MSCPKDLLKMIWDGVSDEHIAKLVEEVVAGPVVPGVKSLIANDTADDAWSLTRAPLTPTCIGTRSNLFSAFYDLQ